MTGENLGVWYQKRHANHRLDEGCGKGSGVGGGQIKPNRFKDNQAILEMVEALEATQTLNDPCLRGCGLFACMPWKQWFLRAWVAHALAINL